MTMSKMAGASPFNCPSPLRGGGGLGEPPHVYPQYMSFDYPKAVITKCIILLKVVKVHIIIYLGYLTL